MESSQEGTNEKRQPNTIEEIYNAKITDSIGIPELDGSMKQFLVLRSKTSNTSALYSIEERKVLTFKLYNSQETQWFHGWWVMATFPMFLIQSRVLGIISLCDLDGSRLSMVLDEAWTEKVFALENAGIRPDEENPHLLHVKVNSLHITPSFVV